MSLPRKLGAIETRFEVQNRTYAGENVESAFFSVPKPYVTTAAEALERLVNMHPVLAAHCRRVSAGFQFEQGDIKPKLEKLDGSFVEKLGNGRTLLALSGLNLDTEKQLFRCFIGEETTERTFFLFLIAHSVADGLALGALVSEFGSIIREGRPSRRVNFPPAAEEKLPERMLVEKALCLQTVPMRAYCPPRERVSFCLSQKLSGSLTAQTLEKAERGGGLNPYLIGAFVAALLETHEDLERVPVLSPIGLRSFCGHPPLNALGCYMTTTQALFERKAGFAVLDFSKQAWRHLVNQSTALSTPRTVDPDVRREELLGWDAQHVHRSGYGATFLGDLAGPAMLLCQVPKMVGSMRIFQVAFRSADGLHLCFSFSEPSMPKETACEVLDRLVSLLEE